MTGVVAGVTGAVLIMVTVWRASRPPRRPFTLAPAWREVPGVTRHRAAPDPGRDWAVW